MDWTNPGHSHDHGGGVNLCNSLYHYSLSLACTLTVNDVELGGVGTLISAWLDEIIKLYHN